MTQDQMIEVFEKYTKKRGYSLEFEAKKDEIYNIPLLTLQHIVKKIV